MLGFLEMVTTTVVEQMLLWNIFHQMFIFLQKSCNIISVKYCIAVSFRLCQNCSQISPLFAPFVFVIISVGLALCLVLLSKMGRKINMQEESLFKNVVSNKE
jgi:hypothetical protein